VFQQSADQTFWSVAQVMQGCYFATGKEPLMHERPVTPAQLRAGRGLLGLSQAELAERADLPVEAITGAEADGEAGTSAAMVAALQAALERQGVTFLAADAGEGPGVRLRRAGPSDEGLRPDQLTSDNDI
jgi:transcriptional regulator with XRE-family HTH domain